MPLDEGFIDHNGPVYYRRDPDGAFVFGSPITRAHCNSGLICHGGWLATMLDMVMPLSVKLRDEELAERFLLTVNMSLDYLGVAPLGSWIEGRGQLLRKTRRLLFLQGMLTLDGEPIVRGSTIMRIGDTAPRIVF